MLLYEPLLWLVVESGPRGGLQLVFNRNGVADKSSLANTPGNTLGCHLLLAKVGVSGPETPNTWTYKILGVIVRSPFIVWAPSRYGRVAILWFRQFLCHRDPPTPHVTFSQIGSYTVYTYRRWAGCHRDPPPPPMWPKVTQLPHMWSLAKLGHIQCTHMGGGLDVTGTPLPPPPTVGLQRPYGQYTVYTYGRWAGYDIWY